MAEAVAGGAGDAGADVVLRSAEQAEAGDLLVADAVILGSGVHMGGIESSMRAFFERSAPLWMQGALAGKLGAAFATAGAGARGGAELALLSLLAFLAENGMLLVPTHNRQPGYAAAGCHWGPIAWTNPRRGVAGPTEAHLTMARAHGRHVAECATRWGLGRVPP
jgi:NAD(P)H dehydrogenase (quinone)